VADPSDNQPPEPTAPPAPTPHSSGFTLSWPAVGAIAATIAAIGSLIGGLAAAGVIGGSSSTGTPAQSGGGSSGTSPAATTPNQQLLAHIPSELRPSCSTTTPGPATAIAAETCLATGFRTVTYVAFPSLATLNGYFMPRYNEAGGTGKTCSGTKPYNTTYHDGSGVPGKLICYTSGSIHWIEWSSNRLFYYCYVSTTGAFGTLYDWWLAHAGPV
jgi:hypothetical protein